MDKEPYILTPEVMTAFKELLAIKDKWDEIKDFIKFFD